MRTTRPCFRQVGSSPLTRGKLLVALSACDAGGLIPAHAGKTPRAHQHRPRPRAHPRSRGENRRRRCVKASVAGSSPLTRGKRHRGRKALRHAGLIPAHAGKTRCRRWCRSCRWAHPRSRGENVRAGARRVPYAGSSPLTRGKQGGCFVTGGNVGLIPAHAGKTRPMSWKQISSGAHPRSRGENASQVRRWLEAKGSSPLTRGKH